MRHSRHITIGIGAAALTAGLVFAVGFRPTSTPSDVELSVSFDAVDSHDHHDHDHSGHHHHDEQIPTSGTPEDIPDNWIEPASLSNSRITSETGFESTNDGNWQFWNTSTFTATAQAIDSVFAELQADGMNVFIVDAATYAASVTGNGITATTNWDVETQIFTFHQVSGGN